MKEQKSDVDNKDNENHISSSAGKEEKQKSDNQKKNSDEEEMTAADEGETEFDENRETQTHRKRKLISNSPRQKRSKTKKELEDSKASLELFQQQQKVLAETMKEQQSITTQSMEQRCNVLTGLIGGSLFGENVSEIIHNANFPQLLNFFSMILPIILNTSGSQNFSFAILVLFILSSRSR